ncbi:hypothetical protein OJAV_G00184610 [Oryzias javanicus]|uniref:Ig-like domain-containing protein n=1 Tax=Oryzias javanicus TaxID=123683 RepID=A0A3S2PH13_ORYJA|nr:hypothetical protein OJAV_G00184610 [Oryzias javanicus]
MELKLTERNIWSGDRNQRETLMEVITFPLELNTSQYSSGTAGDQKDFYQISAAPGDDVILPCRLDSEEDLQDHMVEWTKLEIEPDPAGRRFVYLYHNRTTKTKFMLETFIQRVSLNPDGLKRGDVTLKIRKVTLQDEGTYRCFIPGLNHRETVHLVVGEFLCR